MARSNARKALTLSETCLSASDIERAKTAFDMAQGAEVMKQTARLDVMEILVHNQSVTVHTLVRRKDATVVCDYFGTIADYLTGHEIDGIRIGAVDVTDAVMREVTAAANRAVIKALSGLDEPTATQVACYTAAREAARNFIAKYGEDAPKLLNRDNEWELVQVPYSALHAEPNHEAPLAKHVKYATMKDQMVVVTGSDGDTFSAMAAALKPKVARPNANNGGQGETDKVDEWALAVRAKLAGEKGGEDWVAYVSDWSAKDLIMAARLFSEFVKEDGGEDDGEDDGEIDF